MCGGVYCRKNHGICDVNRENVQGECTGKKTHSARYLEVLLIDTSQGVW